jgi:protease PrsW
MALPRPDPERNRRIVGAVLYGLFMLGGLVALVFFFLVMPLASDDPGSEYLAMGIGAVCALPPLAIYIWIPRLMDRFDPEPWWALALVLAWGGVAACGVAATVNTGVEVLASAVGGKDFAEVMGACFSAPMVEEGMKGLAVFGVFFFLKREFDGVVDGVIYATFAALGFAAVENIIYYGGAVKAEGGEALAATFILRGVLAPWGHPLYTSMTGLGFGIARETNSTAVKWLAPIGGYCAAMFLHAVWNGAATLGGFAFIVMLPLWFLFVLGFAGLLLWLVIRKGRIIRAHLQDEVLLGTLTREELMLATSAFGGMRAGFSWGGSAGRKFVRTVARLGLSKWHTGRAMKGRKQTVSADWIVPLRQEIGELRVEMSRALGRPLPQPQAWTPQQAQRPAYPPGYPAQYPAPYPAQGLAPYPAQMPAQYPAQYPPPTAQPAPYPQPQPQPQGVAPTQAQWPAQQQQPQQPQQPQQAQAPQPGPYPNYPYPPTGWRR